MVRSTPIRFGRPALIAGVLALTVLAASCSGSSDAGSTTTTTKSTGATSTTTAAEGEPATSTTAAQPKGTTTTLEPRGPEDEADYVKGLAAMINDSTPLDAAGQSRVEDCLAPKWVTIIGVDGFAKAGIAPDGFADMSSGLESLGVDATQAQQMVAVFDTCQIDVRGTLVQQLTTTFKADEKTAACIDKAVTADGVKQTFIANLTGQQIEGGIYADAQACLAPAN